MKDIHDSSTPEGYNTLTPALAVRGGKAAMDFYQRVLGATVKSCMDGPNDTVMHAEMNLGDSRFMLSDEFPEWGTVAPPALGGTPISLHVYVADVDAVFARAIEAGAKELMPLADQFWGDRMGQFLDPFGHKWAVAKRIENVSDEETERRGREWIKENSAEKA